LHSQNADFGQLTSLTLVRAQLFVAAVLERELATSYLARSVGHCKTSYLS